MKVLVLANSILGLYRFRKELLQQLVRQNHTVYCAVPGEERAQELKSLGCVVINTTMDRRGTNFLQEI